MRSESLLENMRICAADSRPSGEFAFSSAGGERSGCVEGCVLKMIFLSHPWTAVGLREPVSGVRIRNFLSS